VKYDPGAMVADSQFDSTGDAQDSNLSPARVHDRESFLAFVRALLKDYDLYTTEAVAPSGLPYAPWENGTDFGENLSACLNWASHPIARERGFSEEPSWQSFARFLYMAKIFE
jgi:hypothetical protein